MSEISNVILLGIVQGLTEFLPISSSGHLILAREFLTIQIGNDLAFDAVLQLATTLAVFVYFRKDILGYIENFFFIITKRGDVVEKKERTLLYAVIIGTIPGVIAGLFLESSMETIFRNTNLVALTLIVGALVMVAAELVFKQRLSSPKRSKAKLSGTHVELSKDETLTKDIHSRFHENDSNENNELTIKKGLLVGLFQSLALVPGFSRSGMTISGGLFAGLSREDATRFSFLLAFPILVGSGAKKILDLAQDGVLVSSGLELFAGAIVAFIVGIFAIHFLLTYLKTHTLYVFVWYRVVLAVVILLMF